MSSSMSPAFDMTCLRSWASSRGQPSTIESADWIIATESSLATVFGAIDIASAANLRAPIKYANDENEVPSAANSRQPKSAK